MKVADDKPAPTRQSKRKAATRAQADGSIGRGRGNRKVRVPRNAGLVRFLLHPAGKTLLARHSPACCSVAGMGVFVHFYNVYSKMIDERLRGGPYSTTARIFAAPGAIAVDDRTSPSEIAALLRHAGYSENRNNPIGSCSSVQADSIDIFPGADSYFDQEPATVKFAGGKIQRRTSYLWRDNTEPAEPSSTIWSRSSSPTSTTATAKSSASCITKTSPPCSAMPCSPPRISASSSIPASIPSA